MPILKISLRAWRESPASQLGASLISAALLLCVALLLCLEVAIGDAESRIERENRVSVFVSPRVSADEEHTLVDRIRVSLGAHADSAEPGSLSVVRVSPGETLKEIRDRHPQLHAEILDLGKEGESIVPGVVHVTGSFEPSKLGQASAELRRLPGVEAVETTEARVTAIRPAIRGFQWLSRLLMLGVASAWVLGWIALARSHAASLAGVQGPLRLWGASSSICRAPGILAGLWVGLPAGIFSALAYAVLARPVLQRLADSSGLFAAGAIPGIPGVILLLVTGTFAGVLSGALSGNARA